MKKSPSGLNHNNARTDEQKKLMKKIESDGVCPFCAKHFIAYHPKPIHKETDYWFVTENMSPYEGTKYHFLFVYKPKHISSLATVSPEAGQDLFALLAYMTKKYAIKGGSFFMRFGDTEYNGATVEHLHAHLIMGTKHSEETSALRVKLGWKI